MSAMKKRSMVAPLQQDPSTLFRDHLIKSSNAKNLLVSEYAIVNNQRPPPFWMQDLQIPQWLLYILASLTVVVFTGFAIFASVVTLKKESNEGPCRSNSDCRRDLGLLCNNYRCGCGYSHFWSSTLFICERKRMINRTCINDSMCDNLANLECFNVTLSPGLVESQCQCSPSMTWDRDRCDYQRSQGGSCLTDSDCDESRFLFCISNLCQCNASMFWNGNGQSGTCEYKRTVNQYCRPYDDNWCANSGPNNQGLICANYTNPYGSVYGICQCPPDQFYDGNPSSGNGLCVPLRGFNQSCTTIVECDYRLDLQCLNNRCTCSAGSNFDPTIINGPVLGQCVPARSHMENCSSAMLCSDSQGLYCDLSFFGGANLTGVCRCNESWSYWDGITCAPKLSIGGHCTSNSECIESKLLFCSNYSQSLGTCDCDLNHYWNETCLPKLWYNESCSSSYVCDDNRGLQCQGLGNAMFQRCDCLNSSYIWDSIYVNNQSYTCIPRKSYNMGPCFGDLECEDFNLLKCNQGICQCGPTDYWDGVLCQPKRTYLQPCTASFQCNDNQSLICAMGASNATQCLCPIGLYWANCTDQCVVAKQRWAPCTFVSNCTSNECDESKKLDCVNYNNNGTGPQCDCNSLRWWNGSTCRDKGLPAWVSSPSAICNDSSQCADYNLVSCPLGLAPGVNGTCECATTKYWNGFTCVDRKHSGEPCISWPDAPLNTTNCLSAAGAGLLCNVTTCVTITTSPLTRECTGGFCHCPGSRVWNSTFLICV